MTDRDAVREAVRVVLQLADDYGYSGAVGSLAGVLGLEGTEDVRVIADALLGRAQQGEALAWQKYALHLAHCGNCRASSIHCAEGQCFRDVCFETDWLTRPVAVTPEMVETRADRYAAANRRAASAQRLAKAEAKRLRRAKKRRGAS